MNPLLLILGLGAAVSASAATYYIKPLSSGSGTGTDWNNARGWTNINWGAVGGGDTLYLAGGTYPWMKIDAGGSSTNNLLKLLRATTTAHGTDTGWNNSLDSTIYSTVSFRKNFIYVDGMTRGGITALTVDGSDWEGPNYGAVYMYNCTGCTIRNLSAILTGDPGWAGNNANIVEFANATNCTISYCYGTNLINGFIGYNWQNCVFDHNEFDHIRAYNSPLPHGNVIYNAGNTNCTYAYNYVHDCDVGVLGFAWEDQPGGDNNYLYGNLFVNNPGPNGGIQSDGNVPSPYLGHYYIYNNTFVDTTALFFKVPIAGAEAYNNLFWNANILGNAFTSITHDYNWYGGTTNTSSGGLQGETHGVFGGTTNPFLSYGSRNYHLISNTASAYPVFKGTSLASAFATDPDGVSRIGKWSMGAYEVTGTAPTNTPAVAAPSIPTSLRLLMR